MHKIGVVSDTHGMLRPEVLEHLEGCERILHGGDINKQSVLDQLEQIAPVTVVRGNNDKEWANYIPEFIDTEVCGLRIYMTHIKNFIPKDLKDVDLIIYGHSHKYDERPINGIRALNPGSCGPRRFGQEITMALLWIDDNGRDFRIEKILIPHVKKSADGEEKIPADIGEKIPAIMKEISAGKTVKQIAKKYSIPEEISASIVRMYLTHPGVDADGIMRRIGL